VGRAAQLLLSGAVLGRRFQPYEAHIPYLLQIKASKKKKNYAGSEKALPT
jgi:hypothetical protein